MMFLLKYDNVISFAFSLERPAGKDSISPAQRFSSLYGPAPWTEIRPWFASKIGIVPMFLVKFLLLLNSHVRTYVGCTEMGKMAGSPKTLQNLRRRWDF